MAFDIVDFQVPQGEAELLSTKVGLRGPRGGESVRTHKTWRAHSIPVVRHAGKYFVVGRALRPILRGYWFTVELRAACSSTGEIFVWPVRDDDETVKEAAETAVDQWTTVEWVTKAKSYTVEPAKGSHGDPVWPDGAFKDLLESALAGRVLATPEDEIVLAIRQKKVQVKKKARDKDDETKAEKKTKAK